MGSFNVACSVSNLTIHEGDEVVFIPLITSGFPYPPASRLIYPTVYYRPFSLPIRGVYGDYGRISSIVKDSNVQALEDYFGMPIEHIMLWLTDREDEVVPEDEEKEKLLTSLSGMFVLKEIYDAFSLTHVRKKNAADHYVTEESLVKLGFQHTGSFFIKEHFPYDIQVGEYSCTVTNKDGGDHWTVYSLFDFKKRWEELTKDFLDIPEFEATSQFDVEYDEFRSELLRDEEEYKMDEGEIKTILDESVRVRKLARLNERREHVFSQKTFYYAFRDWPLFFSLYRKSILEGKLKNDTSLFRGFQHYFSSCNRFYFPAMNGQQHGDDEASKFLLDLSSRIVEKRLKNQ